MKTLTINLPESLDVGGPAGHERAMPTSTWSDEFVLNMMLHGIKQRRTDRFSVVKSADGASKAIEALVELDAKLIAGELPTGGGGGGPRLSVEVAGWLAYFKSKGCKIKLVDLKVGKRLVPSSDTLDQFQIAYVREAIWPSVSKVLATMDRTAQDDFRANKLPGIIEKNKAHVITLAEQNEKEIKPFIDAEKLKRGGATQSNNFHVEVDINL